jgi:TatD DNase family protein
MKLIDIGVNLMNSAYDRDREDVIHSAAVAGVAPLIITGSGVKTSMAAAEYAAKFPQIGRAHV